MVSAVRQGASLRETARRFRVSPATVQLWVGRAGSQRLDRVDFSDRPSRPQHSPQRTSAATTELVLQLRQDLQHSDLGEFGAAALQRALIERGHPQVPSVRTIGRLLERWGALDGRRRRRFRPPPRGWYLPPVAAGEAELDSVDVVEGLVIKGGPQVDVLTAISLHGGLAEAWPATSVSAAGTVAALSAHWQAVGLPAYAQFDNDTRFQGPHQHADVVGRVMRLCLGLGVTPVFAPPRESGFQAAIESFNGRWQQKVWTRFRHESLAALQAQSARYVAATRQRSAVRRESAPERRALPAGWRLNLQASPQGQIIFLRRTSEQGAVSLLGHTFAVARTWPHRLVRGEVDLDAGEIRFYALRRRDPQAQPLLHTVAYQLPHRRFRE
jgi:transposase